jgi:hypothetical protein
LPVATSATVGPGEQVRPDRLGLRGDFESGMMIGRAVGRPGSGPWARERPGLGEGADQHGGADLGSDVGEYRFVDCNRRSAAAPRRSARRHPERPRSRARPPYTAGPTGAEAPRRVHRAYGCAGCSCDAALLPRVGGSPPSAWWARSVCGIRQCSPTLLDTWANAACGRTCALPSASP